MPPQPDNNGYAYLTSSPRHSREHGNVIDHLDYDEQVHIASEAEKRRLWWRNAFINALFIASWCVSTPCLTSALLLSRKASVSVMGLQ